MNQQITPQQAAKELLIRRARRALSGLVEFLHAKQLAAFLTHATELLYGGAAGGGKSYLMRIAAIVWCAAIPGLQVYLFRRTHVDLVKNHMEGPKGFRALLARWTSLNLVTIVEGEIRFWNKAKIYLCHCKDEKDIYKYQGAEIHVLLIDELTHFTETMYRFLRNRVRMVGINLPEEFVDMFPRILCGANPGNIGHLWVKATFVVCGHQPMEIYRTDATEGGMRRQFIPAMLEDNPSMATDDPGYEHRLEGLGSAQLVRAMRHGDWDVIEGAFFGEFSRQRHVIDPFKIPGHWTRFISGDWGSAKPFSFGWWAVVGDDMYVNGRLLPRGALIRYREWYGSPNSPSSFTIKIGSQEQGRSHPNNQGLKLPAETVAAGIRKLETIEVVNGQPVYEKINYGVLDPAAFSSDGGKSIAERMAEAPHRVIFRRADNKRVPQHGAMGGWDQLRARLIGTCERTIDGEVDWASGTPMIFFFSTCLDTIRTLPALQHDLSRPEDVDTNNEDHCADDVRYACMSRPYARPEKVIEPIRGANEMTMSEAWNLAKPTTHSDTRI
jgi:hypothetical protein